MKINFMKKGDVDPLKIVVGAIIIIATLLVLFLIITKNADKMGDLWSKAFG